MAQIVGVHGMGQQLKGAHTLKAAWLPALQDGLSRAEARTVAPDELVCAFYGDLFRLAGHKGGILPPYSPADVQPGFEQELLEVWWREAAAIDAQVPGGDTKLRTPNAVQRALRALSGSRYFAGLAEQALIAWIKQVHHYLTEPRLRRAIRDRVAAVVGDDTRVIVGHSLGSVVAYEALCANPDWPIRTLVTLGSPLGIRTLIFERLDPAPHNGIGVWPGGVTSWTNIADTGDVVALVKQLQPAFGNGVEDVAVYNGAKAHDITPYLTARETGRAVAAGLGG